MSKLIDYVAKAAAEQPYRIALLTSDRLIHFGELPFLAIAAANRLNLINPGSGPIAILSSDSIDWIIAHLGARQLGRTTISACTDLKADDLAHCLEAMGVTVALTSSGMELLSPAKTQNFGTEALMHIVADDCGEIKTAGFSEADIFRLGRNLPTNGNWARHTDVMLPTAISDFYSTMARSKTCAPQGWISKHVSRRWAAAMREPNARLLVQ